MFTLHRPLGGSGSAKPCSGFALCTILLHHSLPALQTFGLLIRAWQTVVNNVTLCAMYPEI